MKYTFLLTVVFLIISCKNSTDNEDEIKTLESNCIDYQFTYDVTALPGFILKNFVSIQSDTLEIYDYWALTDQPPYKAEISDNKDTLHISYIPVSIIENDWTPTVETYLKIYLHTNYDEVILHFNPVENGREINITGFRNANKDFYYTLSL